MTPAVRRARTAFVWIGLVIPLAGLAVAAIIVALWLPELPEPSAIHWSGETPDGFGPRWTPLAILAGIAAMIIAFAALAWFAHRLPASSRTAPPENGRAAEWSSTSRALGATNLGLAALIVSTTLAMVGSQRGLSDAADAPSISGATILGLALLVVGAVVGWFLQPRAPRGAEDRRAEATPLPSTDSERVVWIGRATIARSGLAVLGGSALLVGALAAVMAASGVSVVAVVTMVACVVLVLATLLLTTSFRVRVGPGGLRVRSTAGWPRIDIPASDITSVRRIDVDPFSEFGGWGMRYAAGGRSGVVLRAGEALEVTRDGGRRFAVTVDDAETAAAVLAIAVEQSKAGRRPS